jgi:hypothetical protein
MGKNKIKGKDVLTYADYFEDVTSLQIILAIHPSGVTVSKCYYNAGKGIQENLVSAALSVITTFQSEISDQMGMEVKKSKERIQTVDYENFTITVLDGKSLRIAIISNQKLRERMREKCMQMLLDYEKKHEYDLAYFSGETTTFEDFPQVVEKEIDGKLNKRCIINHLSLLSYDAPKRVRKTLASMYSMEDVMIPAKIPSILMREGGLESTEARFYTYDAYISYVIEPK